MKTAGIIAEYNPFHTGHQYLFRRLREQHGADYLITVISGDFVQRGAPAILPKHLRAEMALSCGADLVLELPAACCTASAERFALGGVSILDGLGAVDILGFGCEEGDSPLFLQIASILNEEPGEYREILRKKLREGLSFPAARCEALLAYTDSGKELGEFLQKPNNILGVEYCRAILRLHSPILPAPIRRTGSGYHENELQPSGTPSASALRSFLLERRSSLSLTGKVPEPALSLLREAGESGSFLTEKDLSPLLHYCLLLETPETLCRYADVSRALAERICNLRNRYQDFSQFAELLKTKEMTYTRICRSLLHILLRIEKMPKQLPYARVLGFRREAAPLLRKIKENGRIPLLTKLADAPALLGAEGLALLKETTDASNIYESILCQKTGSAFHHEYEKPVIIL